MLSGIRDSLPELFAYCCCTYLQPSFLYLGGNTILSHEGTQQGDPSAPPILQYNPSSPFITFRGTRFKLPGWSHPRRSAPRWQVRYLYKVTISISRECCDCISEKAMQKTVYRTVSLTGRHIPLTTLILSGEFSELFSWKRQQETEPIDSL